MGPDRTRTPHLLSAVIAVAVAVMILFAGRMVAIHLERRAVAWTAPKRFQLKDQGMVFQRMAARARRVLPLYGSSELVVAVPDRANKFFQNAPTGFQVSPVGTVGATSLIILQKIAALGSDLRGRKLAISLSPIWFFMPATKTDWYEGNFSLLAASELTFGGAVDFELKRDIASRMLQFPGTLEKSPLLEFALRRLSTGSWFDRLIFCAILPFGKIYTAGLELQDHFAVVAHIMYVTKPALAQQRQRSDRPIPIANVSEVNIRAQAKVENAPAKVESMARGRLDPLFLSRMNAASEWADLELLLRALAKVHARPLLLSMPMDGRFYDQQGYSRSARESYYEKMRALAQRYNFALIEFEDHDEDPTFLDAQHTHLTQEGWLFYNRALDDFFHGRVPRS
jgi:Protein involved in D-alanine esterification of lipoteichoic acid and wall teichoic acid (D-alanine transfer protein)